MPLLDDQQHEQVTEMIRAGLQRGLEVHTGQLTSVHTQVAKAGNELESMLAEFTLKMVCQVTTLRSELEI